LTCIRSLLEQAKTTSVDQLDPLRLDGGTITSSTVSLDGKYIASVFRENRSIVHIFTTSDGLLVKRIPVPGFEKADHVPATLMVSCAWAPDSLVVVSSLGHIFSCDTGTWSVHVSVNLKTRSSNFHKVAVHKDRLAFVASDQEIVILERYGSTWELIKGKSSIVFSRDEPDHVLSMDIHPGGGFLTLCSLKRRSLIVVALDGSQPDLVSQLSRAPRETDDEEAFQTPAEVANDDEAINPNFPSIINEFKLSGSLAPVACSWSKYGDNLVIASSDRLLSIWNVPSRSLATVSVSDNPEELMNIRNVRFVNDVIVAVAVHDCERILFVDVDEGVLYEAPRRAGSVSASSKTASLDFSYSRSGSKVVIYRPSARTGFLNRWCFTV
jgi:WD40 repeat protein